MKGGIGAVRAERRRSEVDKPKAELKQRLAVIDGSVGLAEIVVTG
jgi:hypothetical protein